MTTAPPLITSQSPGAKSHLRVRQQPTPRPGMSFDINIHVEAPTQQQVEQLAWRIRGGALCCGSNKDSADDKLAAAQQPLQQEMAQSMQSTQLISALQPQPPTAIPETRDPRPSNASKRTPSLQGPLPVHPEPKPDRRMPAKTLPANHARPDLPRTSRLDGGRAQSMKPRTARPSLP